ncbi:MAG: cell division protein FtsA [Candidatus Berkelbacteria bacterium]|nr:cell division protein FtsA [Candidatus Berkelbacteria bacterium]
MKEDEGLVVALDVGTSKVTVIVGQIQEGMINITGIGRAPNSGLRKGCVVDIEDTVSAISASIEEAQRTCGTELISCFASISGNQIISVDSKGVVAVSRADSEIQEEDVERVTESANSVALPPNYEIIHSIPKSYIVDGQTDIKNPIGMAGIRLEVISHVIGCSTMALKSLSKAITQSGLEIEGMVFAPLASAKVYLSKRQKEIGTVLIDIGASNTSIAVYEECSLIHSKVIPIGSNHITNDIAIGLKISIDGAEKIKTSKVNVDIEEVRESEKIDLAEFERGEKERPNRRYICEIAAARLSELFGMIRDELKSIQKDEMLPAGAVITGGGARLEGLQQLAKKSLGLPVQIGQPIFEVSGIVDKLDDPEYATAIGLLIWGLDEIQTSVSNGKRANTNLKKMGGAFSRVKEIFKNFIP